MAQPVAVAAVEVGALVQGVHLVPGRGSAGSPAIAGIVAIVAGAVMVVLVVLGVRHQHKVVASDR